MGQKETNIQRRALNALQEAWKITRESSGCVEEYLWSVFALYTVFPCLHAPIFTSIEKYKKIRGNLRLLYILADSCTDAKC